MAPVFAFNSKTSFNSKTLAHILFVTHTTTPRSEERQELVYLCQPVLLWSFDNFALTRAWQGAIEKRLKRGLSSNVGVGRPKKSVRRVMTQINPAQLPNKLIAVEVTTQMPLIDGLPDELPQ
jgi:hypothetical protein